MTNLWTEYDELAKYADELEKMREERGALLVVVRGLEESLEEIREWAQSTALRARHSEVLLVVERMCDKALAGGEEA